MKYLRLFDTHDDYVATAISDIPNVAYDNEHVHYNTEEKEEDDGEPTDETTIVE